MESEIRYKTSPAIWVLIIILIFLLIGAIILIFVFGFSGCTPPSPPSNVTASLATDGTVNVTWTASTDTVDGYLVRASQSSLATNATVTGNGYYYFDLPVTTSTNLLLPGGTYYISVQAYKQSGNARCFSDYSPQSTSVSVPFTPVVCPFIPAPTVSISGSTISFSSIPNAIAYNLYSSSTNKNTGGTYVTSVLDNGAGTQTINIPTGSSSPYYYIIAVVPAIDGSPCFSAPSATVSSS